MDLKKMVCTTALAGSIGVAGILGMGLGAAAADPGQQCAPNTPNCAQNGPQGGGQNNNNGPRDNGPQNNGPGGPRGIDQGRQDHQPFMYGDQQVHPLPAGNGDGWGFWFLGQWIRL